VSAAEKILELSPDLIFLDVQMPGMDGFEVLRKARARRLDLELQELIRMRAQGLITDLEFLHQRKRTAEQRAPLEDNRLWQALDVAEVREQFQEIATPLLQLRQTWQTIQPSFRRRFERLVLPAGFVVGQTRTAELGGLFRFLGGFAPSFGLGCQSRRMYSFPSSCWTVWRWRRSRAASASRTCS
jgi:CheY-like chemotaxis protein